MAGMTMFALDFAGLIYAIAPKGEKDRPNLSSTNIQILVGHSANDNDPKNQNWDPQQLGGGCPDVALWDTYGERIGQYKPEKGCRIKTSNVAKWNIPHKQTKPAMEQRDVGYVLISTMSNDAICISQISIRGNTEGSGGDFYGDIGYKCGMSWFLTDDASVSGSRCVWLDADHTDKINARALSFHVPDLVANPSKLAQYQENLDTLCKSTPRFSFWGNLLPNAVIPFFNPPLQYTGGNGADVDIKRIIDDPKHPYDKGKYMRRRNAPKARREENKGYNHDVTKLIISEHRNVREVCEHPNSYGWDIVSKEQSLFCCMEHKQLYPLCTPAITDKCFDLDAKTLRGVADMHPSEAKHMRFGRSYNSTSHWKN